MSTPGFVAQDSNSLSPVRYYTPFDPYYFAVDNRPLQDLASNITTISSGGGDSARRAVLLNQLAMSSVFLELFSTKNAQGAVSGLEVSYPAANTIQIGPGALYQIQSLNAAITTPTVKQALLLDPYQTAIVQPVTSGQSINYLVQVQYRDLSSANMPTSALPFLDPDNTFLPCLLLNGELVLGLKTGNSAPTGTQTTPAPDAGWIPLYVVTATYGASDPVVTLASNAPALRGLNRPVTPVTLPVGGATSVAIADISTLAFANGSTQGVSLPISLKGGFDQRGLFPNPYAPIKLKIAYSSNDTGGNFALRLRYLALGAGESTALSYTTTSVEAMPMNVAANSMATYSLATAVIPASVFSGLLNGSWSVTKEKLFAILERIGGDPADTATGNLYVHDVIAYQ